MIEDYGTPCLQCNLFDAMQILCDSIPSTITEETMRNFLEDISYTSTIIM